MNWEIVLVPALLCFLAGILSAAAWMEQELLGAHQAVLLRVADQPRALRRDEMAPAGGMSPWADDTSRSAA
jgi:hypothetical protein